jgi:hypothetical protein
MIGCETPMSAARIAYQSNRPSVSRNDTKETQLSVQNLDVAMQISCKN